MTLEEHISKAKALLLIISPEKVIYCPDVMEKWNETLDTAWILKDFENTEHLHRTMMLFEEAGLNPHIVPDSEGMEDCLTEETIYLRLAPPDKHYNTPDDVWPEYRFYQQAMREAYGQASSI